MVLECLTWIPHIWGQLVSPFIILHQKSPIRPLPDDITMDILSRLPVDCILVCRRVCKNWRALTSSPCFAELQLKKSTAPPSLFVQWLEYARPMKREQLNFFIYDKAGQKAHRKKSIIIKVRPRLGPILYPHNPVVVGSCNGLLMFLATRSSPMIFILNPITWELVTLPAPFRLTSPCGIYFLPSTCEYKLLFSVYKVENRLQCYYTYSLKSKVCKKLNYSSSCMIRGSPPAILLNRSLHWMVNRNKVISSNHTCTDGIIVFGTETEDIRFLPHPGPKGCYNGEEEHENMYLLEMREHLCLCHVLWRQLIYVWVLEDYSNWVWDRRYKVNLNWDVNRFPFNYSIDYSTRYNPKFLKVLGIRNSELVIAWDSRGVFSYNLEQNTVSKIKITVEGSSLPLPFASAFTKSLVSLRYLLSGLSV
ncbi:hypothetical protein LguiB_006345 [Lonicera macranthoides]